MKEVFQMLKDPRFHLVYGVTQRYSNGPEPRRVRLNREGYKLVEGVTKKGPGLPAHAPGGAPHRRSRGTRSRPSSAASPT